MKEKSPSEIVEFHINNILRNDPKMTKYSLSELGWGDDVILKLCELLIKNDYITELDLSRNDIHEAGATALAQLPLKHLNLRLNSVNDEAALALAKNKSLEWLDLQGNSITDQGMSDLAKHTNCLIIYQENNRASRENAARVDAACAYNRLKKEQKLLAGSQVNVIQESRADYIEKHWKKYYKDHNSTIPDLGRVWNVVHVFDPNSREEIFPVDIKI